MHKNPRDIIKRPVITERSTDLMEENKFAFEVDLRANKTEIKAAIEEIFGVKVAKVNTLRVPSKQKRMGRYVGRTSEWKKAVVTLTSDSKPLNFFEGA
ncbi:MAG TPA: 50S ribosomal protein L23 [Bacilli bacterium]|nr:50S ribosomal protein L23 [Bacilli bacterium]